VAVDAPTDGAWQALVERAVYRPLRQGSAVAEAVARLGQAIGMGLLGPGDRLPPETQLAADLGISPVTLRAALTVLRSAGVIETQRGRGARSLVCAPAAGAEPLGGRLELTTGELQDLVDYRAVVESGAAALAAERASEEQLDEIAAACAALDAGTTDYATWARRDTVLHLLIADATGSPRLVREVADLRAELYRLGSAIPVPQSALALANAEHHELLRALRARQTKRARTLMQRHVSSTGAMIAGLGRVRDRP
jgi:GntR family transcriptional regulator, transcriptional repressor for pyruvate dehydrogenase complex